MKDKVIWTTREWALIAKWFVENRVDPSDYGFTSKLDKAQQTVLPMDRHRTMAGLPVTVRTKVLEAIALLPHVALPEAPNEPVRPPEPSAKALSTEELLVELARRFAKLLEPTVQAHPVDRGFHPKHTPEAEPTDRRVRWKIVIVGPKGQQQQELLDRFPGLDLRFVTCEDNPKTIRKGMAADEIILWTKFMNHAQQDMAKDVGRTWYANSMHEIHERLEIWTTR